MSADVLQYAVGNSSSTTSSSSIANSDTELPLTSDTNFAAKEGEGMVLIDEGESTEELAYATGKTGATLTIPLANRGLEGGSAQAHTSGASVKGILTAGMWNAVIDALSNVVWKTTGAAKRIVNVVTSHTPDAAGTATLDLTTGNIQKITMPAGNITIAISNEAVGQCFLVEITQDDVGSRTVTWFTTIRWVDGTAPTLTTTASKRDVFGFRVTGTDTYDGYIVGQNI